MYNATIFLYRKFCGVDYGMPLMTDDLASLLPLQKFPLQKIEASEILHHFGTFDGAKHGLDRPLWVSEDYDCAYQYKNFGVAAPRYTKLVTAIAFEIVDLNGVSLQSIAEKLGYQDHSEWNNRLAAHLSDNGFLGLVYVGREILLADPSKLIKTAGVCSVDA